MNQSDNQSIIQADLHLAACKAAGKPEPIAEALEDLASILIKKADLITAANSLEEAADIWLGLQNSQRFGSCLLLACSSRRLASDLTGAKRVLELALAFEIPPKLQRGFLLELQEQKLAQGKFEEAYQGFTNFLTSQSDMLAPMEQAFVYQRKAVAANLAESFLEASEAFLSASEIFSQEKQLKEAEECALAAAALLMEPDTSAAERIYQEVSSFAPHDGKAAIHRGMLGSKIAQKLGKLPLALKRIEQARQGALDIVDPISYLATTVEASQIASAMNKWETAYAKLATAWVSLADLVGKEEASKLVRPELEAFRDSLGLEKFREVKENYERERRHSTNKQQK